MAAVLPEQPLVTPEVAVVAGDAFERLMKRPAVPARDPPAATKRAKSRSTDQPANQPTGTAGEGAPTSLHPHAPRASRYVTPGATHPDLELLAIPNAAQPHLELLAIRP